MTDEPLKSPRLTTLDAFGRGRTEGDHQRTSGTTLQCPQLLSVPDAAVMLSVSASTIKNLFKCGELTRIKVFRRTLIDTREIEALIERLKEASRDN